METCGEHSASAHGMLETDLQTHLTCVLAAFRKHSTCYLTSSWHSLKGMYWGLTCNIKVLKLPARGLSIHPKGRLVSSLEKASVPVTPLYAISWVSNPEKLQKQPDCLGHVVWKYCYQDPRVPGVEAWVLETLKSSGTVFNWMIKEKTKQGDLFIVVKNIWKREK